MSLLFNFYHSICDFLCHCHSFNPSLCHLSLFLLSCVAVSSHVGFQVIIFYRVVIKISSCRVNTTSRQGIKHLGISFGSNFLLFSNKSSRGPHS